ncbi:MAG: TFIIB-type zinc finger domain-containing protein [Oscillospiraceae bacterium]|nr:TFIIB-type zinc finger domain-containing protein [Oscillospiraceae bacterium]
MTKIVCELCGSNDIIKQDGYFVCQHCGTKYTVEEARKMIVEGVVEVTGTVKIDDSASVQNILNAARRALDKGDWEEVEKSYKIIEQHVPTSIEAAFYSSYGKARLSLVNSDMENRRQAFSVLYKSIAALADLYLVEDSEDNQSIFENIHYDLFDMYNSGFSYSLTKKRYGLLSFTTSDTRNETHRLFTQTALVLIATLENIIKKDDQLLYRKMQCHQYKFLADRGYLSNSEKKTYSKKAESSAIKIKKEDPSFSLE